MAIRNLHYSFVSMHWIGAAQLKHSIKAVYGDGFDANHYLHRFFDQTYRLSVPEQKDLIAFYLNKFGVEILSLQTFSNDPIDDLQRVFDGFNVNARSAIQTLESLGNLHSVLIEEGRQLHLYFAATLILANREGIDILSNEDSVQRFIEEKCNLKSCWKLEITVPHLKVGIRIAA